MTQQIAIIGSGGRGTAAAVHLVKQGHRITLWSWKPKESDRLRSELENKDFLPGIKLPADIEYTADISCVKGKDLIASHIRLSM